MMTSENFFKLLAAQSLRIRQELRAIRPGSLAVPSPRIMAGASASHRPNRPSLARILRDSRLQSSEKFSEEKICFPGAVKADEILEILGFRGWEKPAKSSKSRTGWAPAAESLRFLRVRPAEGEEIFSFQSDADLRRSLEDLTKIASREILP